MPRASTRLRLLGQALRAAAALLVVLVAAPGVAGQERVDGDLYANAKYGIQVAKPASWYFITAGAIVELAKKTAGGGKIRGEEDPVKLAGFAVVISKEPTLGRGIQPQVVVLVHELPAAPPDPIKACEGLRTGMTEPETLKPTRQVEVNGRPAARLDFQGLVDSDMVRATALCTFKGRQAFVVVGQALASEFDSQFSAFESILASFRLR
ncbi:MAG TPA: hypothetical protein VJB36_07210 [Methylomirabilota bacterium]|nr:hypothetical protein [Methylomirabilota bacterium]